MTFTAVKDMTTGFGEISYNGYTFGAIRNVKFADTPITDKANLRVVEIRRKILVHSFVFADSLAGQQANMQSMRAALEQCGKSLKLVDVGFGSPIDTADATKKGDILYGVQVLDLQMIPAGGDYCYEIFWTAEYTAPPTCLANSPVPNAFISFDYDVSYSIDSEGLVTRTIAGDFRVYSIVGGAFTNIESAFDRIRFTLPVIMRRIGAERSIKADKKTLEFRIVDEELTGDAFPDGLVECDFDEDFENIPPGFINWAATITGGMKVAKGYHKSIAAVKFFAILADRITKLNAMLSNTKNGIVIPDRIRMGSKMFGRESRFSVSFRVVACLHDILKGSLWSPVPGTNYASWQASMLAVGVGSPVGVSALRWNPNDKITLDLCDQIAGSGTISVGNDLFRQVNPSATPGGLFSCDSVTEERSYLYYSNSLEGVMNENAKLHRVSQVQMGTQAFDTQGEGLGLGKPNQQIERDHVLQYASAPDFYILLTGRALRLKYETKPPVLKKIGGVDVELMAVTAKCDAITSFFHCTLFSGQWTALYRAKGYISSLQSPTNPYICFDKGQK